MKALTLHQPHAHLISTGAKMFETRSWSTNYRGLIAIHAAKIQPNETDGLVVDPNGHEPTWLEPYCQYLPKTWNDYFGDLCHGGVEALVQLVEVYEAPIAHAWALHRASVAHTAEDRRRFEHMAAFGNFGPGRFAWHVEVRLVVAGNCGLVRGMQGLWTLPKAHEEELLAAYLKTTDQMICRHCGCVESDACIDKKTGFACHWVAEHLCSACKNKEAA